MGYTVRPFLGREGGKEGGKGRKKEKEGKEEKRKKRRGRFMLPKPVLSSDLEVSEGKA